MKKYPLFLLLFTIYPSLALLTWNVREVDRINIILRPLLLSMVIASFVILLFFGLVRNWPKTILLSTICLIFFFSFGHISLLLEGSSLLEKSGNASWLIHIFLPVLLLLVIVLLCYAVLRTRQDLPQTYLTLNVISAFLVLSSCLTLLNNYYLQRQSARSTRTTSEPGTSIATRPDVYYIILDAYARHDALMSLGYDNTEFLQELEDIGFYVASCSRSNYPQTVVSMASAFNMGYLWDVIPNQGSDDRNSRPVYKGILHSQVRKEFEDLGYQIMGFDSGAGWLNWRDADQFIAPKPEPFFSTHLDPFEYIFLDTTALHPLMTQPFFLRNKYVYNYNRILFALDELPKLAQVASPKFVYVHMLIPHRPNIFLPDGSMNLNTEFYIKGVGEGINRQVDIEGYLNNTKFINSRLPEVLRQMIQQSRTPPIIIIQGDHGYQLPDIRFDNLNAYFFPDQNYTALYPKISPVNTFRAIFNTYFGTNYPMQKDQSINVGINRPYGKKTMKPSPCP
jgi:hypothetical protein